MDENVRHLSVHSGHNLAVSNGPEALVDASAAKQMTFRGTREELRERLAQLETRGATRIIFGTSGYDVERELRAYAEVTGLRSRLLPIIPSVLSKYRNWGQERAFVGFEIARLRRIATRGTR